MASAWASRMSSDVLHEIDCQLSENLAWALRIEELGRLHGVALDELTAAACVRLLLQLRSAGLS